MWAIPVQEADKGLGSRHALGGPGAAEHSSGDGTQLSERPGALLSADTFMVGRPKGIGRIYLHAVVETHGLAHAAAFVSRSATGRVKQIAAPPSAASSAQIRPPKCSTIWRQMARPSPVPLGLSLSSRCR